MQVVCGIATFGNRPLDRVINSLIDQVDRIIVYDNETNPNLTDNGKFFGLTKINEPCYYFSVDDDLLYPKDYVKKTIEAIEKCQCIITHHGRQLLGKDRDYYRGHKSFRCLDAVTVTEHLDVAGTGVTAFRTDYFNPNKLHESKDLRMSDLLFSLEAAKQGKKIMIVPHESGWIQQLPYDKATSCHSVMVNNQGRLIQIANEIIDLKTK